MENEQPTNITKIVSNELVTKSIDLGVDYSEIAFDAFLEDGVLKEIPIVKSVVAFYNIGNSVIDRHKTKKILTFFKEFHSQQINDEKLDAFKEKFNEDRNYRERVVDTIILLNERFLDTVKSKVLANLVIAHIEGNISWKELTDIAVVLDDIHPKGFDFLEQMAQEKFWANHKRDAEGEALMMSCGIGHRHGSSFSITEMGQKLYNFGIRPKK